MYLFDLDGANIVPGGHYQLRIATSKNELVTGDMIFPPSLPTAATIPTFDYSRDTSLRLSWAATPAAPAYQVRIESYFGVWSAVTDSASAILSGGLRNVNVINLPHVFIPAFTQQVTVSAIDANAYDYYRTSTNSATGLGIVSRLRGARGVFGGIVTVNRRTLRVTAPLTLPVEGVYQADTSALGYLYGPGKFRLHIESRSERAGQGDVVVAAYGGPTATVLTSSGIGTLTGKALSLAFFRSAAFDTLEVLTAEVRGDTIVGHYSKGAPARFVKR